MSLDNVSVVLSGMSDTVQVNDNLNTFHESLSLSSADRSKLKEAACKQHAAIAVACTSCRYCCPDCPQSFDIPKIMGELVEMLETL